MKRRRVFYLVASAIVAYFYGFPTNGLSHFDEGQYAFARVWPWIDKFDVDQAFFSPPLYPFLVGLVQHLPISRPDLAGVYISWAACWASLYFGVKLAVAWWGRAARFPSFVLLLLSPMRLCLGTIGLTDALFSALLLATLWCATNAFRRNSSRWTLATALLAGSTWSCKYNGFIALGIVAGFVMQRRSASSVVRWLVICVIAGAIMAPWYWAIQRHHPEGLAALQRHQQGYLRGLTAPLIWEGLCQAFSLRAQTPGPSVLLACWVLLGIGWASRRHSIAAVMLATVLAAEEFSFSQLLPVAALVVLPCSVLSSRRLARAPIVLSVLLTVLLPGIYTPYLRLWLPAETILLLVIAGAVAGATRKAPSLEVKRSAIAVAALLLMTPSFIKVVGPAASLFGRRLPESLETVCMKFYETRPRVRPVEGYWPAVQELVDRVNATEADGLLVYARPPLLYYLASSKLRTPVKRMPDERMPLEGLRPGTMIVTDVALRDSQKFAASVREAKRRRALQMVDGWHFSPHPLTMLDDFGSIHPLDVGAYKVSLSLVTLFSEPGP